MAYKMKGFSYPGISPMKQTHDKPKVVGKTKDGTADVKLAQVDVSRGKESTNTNNRLPMYLPGGGDYDPTTATATNTNADKRQSSKEKFNSDVSSFISGIAGVPSDVVEDITGKVSDVGDWVKRGVDKRKAKRLERKQDKIDNPKVKKDKVATNKDKKTKRKSKVDGIDPTNNTGMVTKVVNGVKTRVKAKDRFNDESENRVKKTKPKSKVAKNLGKALEGTGGIIGEQLITQGIGAGIQALLTPKEKEQREIGNPNLSGFSQMKFGRRKMKE